MKEIIKNNIINYELIRIRQNTPVLEYLKKNNFSFRLKQVTPDMLELLKSTSKLVKMEYVGYLAGYGELKGNDFRSSGGLKVSDPGGDVTGSFIIEDMRIIYDALVPFYKERDSYVYGGTEYYTDMTMPDILKEELKRKRQYLIYLGEKLNGYRFEAKFEEVSKDELLEYAQNCEKGKKVLERLTRY